MVIKKYVAFITLWWWKETVGKQHYIFSHFNATAYESDSQLLVDFFFSARFVWRLNFPTNGMYGLLQVTNARANLLAPVLSPSLGPWLPSAIFFMFYIIACYFVILPWESRTNGTLWSFVLTDNIGVIESIMYIFIYLKSYTAIDIPYMLSWQEPCQQ